MLSQRVRELTPSATLELKRKRVELERAGRTVHDLGVGEPDFDTPESVRRAAQSAIDSGWTKYTAVPGALELRERIATWAGQVRGMEITPDRIVVTNGAKSALSAILLSLVDRGDEVIVPAPYWVSYPEMIRVCEGIPVIASPADANGHRLTPADVEPLLTPRTCGMLLNSPSNPTGFIYSREELDEWVAFARGNDLWILSDEIYEDFCFDRPFASTFTADTQDTVMLIGGLSKNCAMTGWRVGWSITDRPLAGTLTRLLGHIAGNPSSVSQAASIAAVDHLLAGGARPMCEEYRTRRDRAIAILADIPGLSVEVPPGGFYVFADVSGLLGRDDLPSSSAELCGDLLEHAGVALVPGEAFGAPGYVRVSFCAGLDAIEAGLAAFRDRIVPS